MTAALFYGGPPALLFPFPSEPRIALAAALLGLALAIVAFGALALVGAALADAWEWWRSWYWTDPRGAVVALLGLGAFLCGWAAISYTLYALLAG